MVTQVSTDAATGATTIRDRGFVADQPALAAEYRSRFLFYPAPFWGPVIAGTLFALSTFVFSWYLMIGCTVGVGADHAFDLGWGAAVWMWVTSAIAFGVGGAIASMISAPRNFGWLKGAAIWGLSIPLGLVAYSFVAGSELMNSLGLPHIGLMHEAGTMVATVAHYDFAWAAFVTLGIGLIFACFGSMSAGPNRAGIDTVAERSTEVPVTH
ncbi:MAG TPA: hypothetical protein VHY37_10675 [Tepidisphaeraceae bacterium]|jgi:hypothetical protein|nr:hypothetical protein [Tepidisphaeraceae bacterium]